MGNTTSSILSNYEYGLRVVKVEPHSPTEKNGLLPYFDYIVAVNGTGITLENTEMLANIVSSSVGCIIKLDVYNMAKNEIREIDLRPSADWGGKGLLGCLVRVALVENAPSFFWHVMAVTEGSPAERAGLRANEDYILGLANREVLDANSLLWALESTVGEETTIIVFNTETGLKETKITPKRGWKDGETSVLGCELVNGIAHRIPFGSKGFQQASHFGSGVETVERKKEEKQPDAPPQETLKDYSLTTNIISEVLPDPSQITLEQPSHELPAEENNPAPITIPPLPILETNVTEEEQAQINQLFGEDTSLL